MDDDPPQLPGASLARWFVEVDRLLRIGGIPAESRTRLLWTVVQRLAGGSGSTPQELLAAGPSVFADQVLTERDRCSREVSPARAMVGGGLGAVAGAAAAWFGVYVFLVRFWLPGWALDQLWFALTLDVLAVAIVLTSSLLGVLIATGERLPGLAIRLAVSGALAALVAWPLITAVAAVHHFTWQPRVLATEVVIGLTVLTASIWVARRWALRARIESLA